MLFLLMSTLLFIFGLYSSMSCRYLISFPLVSTLNRSLVIYIPSRHINLNILSCTYTKLDSDLFYYIGITELPCGLLYRDRDNFFFGRHGTITGNFAIDRDSQGPATPPTLGRRRNLSDYHHGADDKRQTGC